MLLVQVVFTSSGSVAMTIDAKVCFARLQKAIWWQCLKSDLVAIWYKYRLYLDAYSYKGKIF
jgi:hypothetical protein